MFSTLTNGSQIYMLDKGEHLTLKIGQIQTKTVPKPVIGEPFGSLNSTVDIVVNAEGETIKLGNVPGGMSVAHMNNLILTESREGMMQEVENMQRTSQQLLDNIDYHQRVVEECGALMKTLSPQYAKDVATSEKISALEKGMGDLKAMMEKLLNKNIE